jgi:hypothetical protein
MGQLESYQFDCATLAWVLSNENPLLQRVAQGHDPRPIQWWRGMAAGVLPRCQTVVTEHGGRRRVRNGEGGGAVGGAGRSRGQRWTGGGQRVR